MKHYDVQKTEEFDQWLHRLKDKVALIAILKRLTRFECGNLGNIRNLGKISEAKVDIGPGYRLYFIIRGEKLLILLCGGDKSTQSSDIEKAKRMAEETIEWIQREFKNEG